MITVEKDNETVTHMLGYLTPEQWADALKNGDLDNLLVRELIKIQEEVYSFDLIGDVEECLQK